MSEITRVDDNIFQVGAPDLGIDLVGMQKWTQEMKETAQKTDYLARLVVETNVIKWIEPEIKEYHTVEKDGTKHSRKSVLYQNHTRSTYEIPLEKENNIEDDWEDESEAINDTIGGATSYAVLFTVKAYQKNDVFIGFISRKFGQLNLIELRKVNEIMNAPIQLPPITIQVGGRPVMIPSRPIIRPPRPPVEPEMEFKKLFAKLEVN